MYVTVVCDRWVLSVVFGCDAVCSVPIRDSGCLEAALFCSHCETVSVHWDELISTRLDEGACVFFFFFTL